MPFDLGDVTDFLIRKDDFDSLCRNIFQNALKRFGNEGKRRSPAKQLLKCFKILKGDFFGIENTIEVYFVKRIMETIYKI
jgi:hypothetical protein